MRMNFIRVIAPTLLLFMLVACEPQSASMEFKNVNEEIRVLLEGSTNGPLDPWKVKMTILAYDKPLTFLEAEIYLEKLSSEYVSMAWKNEHFGVLTFVQRDDTKRIFKLVADEELTHFYEVSEEELAE